MALFQIKKRNGAIVDFDKERICQAIAKAEESAVGSASGELSHALCEEVVYELESEFFQTDRVPSVEEIQDIVERNLVESGNFEIAKRYILYRAEHAKRRAEERLLQLEKIDKHLLKVTKRNGKKEVFKKEKLKKSFEKIVFGYEKVCDFEELYEVLKLMIVDGITTFDLLRTMRKATLDLITVENIAWQHIAGRIYALEFYGAAMKNRRLKYEALYTPDSFLKHFKDYVKKGYYYRNFFDYYSEEDIRKAGEFIDRERDMTYVYSTMLAFDRRYLLNPNKVVHELPQEMYMAVALFLATPEPKESRLEVARQIYEVCSTQKLSLPTPTLLNARTNYHQLSSCFKLNVDDDLRAIYHQIENMAQISKFGGGVGVYLGHIRSKGAMIREVKNSSGGVVPWVRVINDTACAVNQLGARLGAISPTLDVWHKDIHDFLNLQTESGDIRSKAFDVFPAISVPDLFMKRVEAGEDWTLFDPHEVAKVTGQRMEDLFCEAFEQFYIECEKNDQIVFKESVSARELMKEALKTTVETGMPYFFFRDTVNRVNPNKHVGNVYSTQLCTEICQNTSPSEFIEERVDENNEISIRYKTGDTVVCNLASINVARVNTPEEIEAVFPVAMRVLDNVITLNFYPIKESEITSKKYRPVGLGFMGLAEYLACEKLAYDSEEARERVDQLFERYAFATLQNSQKLSAERGAYPLFPGSEWSKGVLFGRDEKWYKNHAKTNLDWSGLIQDIKQEGLRFGYHLAPAPNTSTSGVTGTTAGLLPIYKKFFVETNVIAPTVTVAPNLNPENFWFYKEYHKLDMNQVIDMFSVVYKWIDQSASFEWMINPAEISPKQLYDYYFKAWKEKIKTVYYLRSMSGEIKETCESCSG
jgi:ribonucleoside-diphosphate reductase alpha chain